MNTGRKLNKKSRSYEISNLYVGSFTNTKHNSIYIIFIFSIMKREIPPKFAAKEISNYILGRNSDKDFMLAVHSVMEVLYRDKVLGKKFLKQLRKELENDNLYIK